MAWFSEQRTGDLLSVLNDDVNQLERFLTMVPTTCFRSRRLSSWSEPSSSPCPSQ